MKIMQRLKLYVRSLVPIPILNAQLAVKSYFSIKIKRLKVALHIPTKKKLKLIRFEVHLAEHCNLNCVGCSHFSPLAEPGFISTEEFMKDMKRMGSIFSHKCEWIHLLGGEPLLNPDIINLMKITRENFSEGLIQVITNGILLLKMSDDFWQACHDNDIEICLTRYPIKVDVPQIIAKAKKFGVSFRYYGNYGTIKNIFHKWPLDLSGKGDMWRNFNLCALANSCIFLRNGKLYPCGVLANVHFFNKYFGQNIPVTAEDCIDIYQDIEANEILRRLAQPVPGCRYCNIEGAEENIMWRVSKREMSEWV